MKKVILIILLLFMLAASANAYNITLSRTHGPYGGDFGLTYGKFMVATEEGSNLYIYSCTNGRGVARSINGGATWEMMSGDPSDPLALASSTPTFLAFHATSTATVFAGTSDKGLWMTSDRGGHWSQVNGTAGKYVIDIATSKNDPGSIYLAMWKDIPPLGNKGVVYKLNLTDFTTSEFGTIEVWGEILSSQTLVYDDYYNKLYCGARTQPQPAYWVEGIFSTTGEAYPWQYEGNTISNAQGDTRLIRLFTPPYTSEVYAFSGITYVKVDDNVSFEASPGYMYSGIGLMISPTDRNFAFWPSGGLIMKTTNHGSTSSAKMSGLPPFTVDGPHYCVSSIVPSHSASPYVFLTSSNGLYRSNDGGESYFEMNGQDYTAQSSDRSFVNTSIKCIAVDDSGTVFAGGVGSAADGNGMFRSTDQGNSWQRINNGLIGLGINSIAVQRGYSPNIVYLIDQTGIYKSLDSGNYWGLISNIPSNCIAVDKYGKAYLGTISNGVYYGVTDEAGVSQWAQLPMDSLTDPSITALCFDQFGAVYAGTATAGIYKYISGSPSWEILDAPGGGTVPGIIYAIAVDPASSEYIYAASNYGIYKSADFGNTWSSVYNNTTYSLYVDKDTDPPTVYASTYDYGSIKGLIKSENRGATWSTVGTPGQDYSKPINFIAKDEASRVFYLANNSIGVSKGVPQLSLPAAPTNLWGSAESSSLIRWRWKPNAVDEFGYYFRSFEAGTLIAALPTQASVEAETGLSPNTYYHRYVEAYNNYGASTSEVSSECTLANPPLNLRATFKGADYITLNWDTNSDPSNTTYVVEISSEADPTFAARATLEASPPPATIYSLLPSTAYWFRVRAMNQKGKFTSYSNTISAETGSEVLGPDITHIRFDGIALLDNDVIRPNAVISADLTDEATYPDHPHSISKGAISINFGDYYTIKGNEIDYFEFSSTEAVYKLRHKLSFPLGPGTYLFSISASDELGNPGSSGVFRVRVIGGSVQVVGPVLTYPTPFKPLSGQRATISYTLSKDANVKIYMYDVGGQIIKTFKFSSAANGGRTGYNSFDWNGVTDYGVTVGNGIYVYKIIANGKVVGTGKIVVYD